MKTKTTITIEVTHSRGNRKGRPGYGRADIVPGESIRLFGTRWPDSSHAVAYDRTFKLGEMAEYGSYNLSYYGVITKITEKTVFIEERVGRQKTIHRLDIAEFEWRNWSFDLAEAQKRNANWSD